MPTRTRKRKVSEEDGVEAKEVAQPVKKTARTTQRKPRVSQGQSSRGGGSPKRGRADQSTTAGNTFEKSESASSSAGSARREIRRSADELVRLIEEQYNKTRPDTFGNSVLSSKFTSILRDGVDTQNIVYRKSYDCIKALQDTIDEYDTINRGSTNIKKPTEGAQWERDAEHVSKVDKKAMEILKQTVHGLVISGDHTNLLRSPSRYSDDIEQAAWRWVAGGIPQAEETWGSSAREIVNAFKGISRLLLN
ncbi:hypothetical protein V8C42DRAFT_359745 [Trichoderma barbatum]